MTWSNWLQNSHTEELTLYGTAIWGQLNSNKLLVLLFSSLKVPAISFQCTIFQLHLHKSLSISFSIVLIFCSSDFLLKITQWNRAMCFFSIKNSIFLKEHVRMTFFSQCWCKQLSHYNSTRSMKWRRFNYKTSARLNYMKYKDDKR